jgi:hypothetical protein
MRRAVDRLAGVPFGVALGCVGALALFALTAFHTWFAPIEADDRFVWLLGLNFMPGIRPTPAGTFIALAWGFVAGFALGWCIAVARNALFAGVLRLVLSRERLRRNSRVLDDLM